jgi:hypothetical protein
MTTASKYAVPCRDRGGGQAAPAPRRLTEVSTDLPLFFPLPHVQNDGEAGAAPAKGHRVDRR